MFIVGVADEVVVPVRFVIRLLVSVCVSEVPKTVPDGAVTDVIAPVPAPLSIPVGKVETPVPPSAIAKSVIPVIEPPVMLALVVAVPVWSWADSRFMSYPRTTTLIAFVAGATAKFSLVTLVEKFVISHSTTASSEACLTWVITSFVPSE